MSVVEIRRALAGDEPQIATVHIRAWQQAYKGLIADDYLESLSSEMKDRTQMWQKILTSPKRWAWIATIENRIVGFILFGTPRDEDRETYIELGAIYLLAEQKGKGIGFALLTTGFDFMRSLNYQKAYCWVLEKNPTIQFYERSGARFFGQTKFDEIAGKEMRELAYEWPSLLLLERL